MHIKIHSNNMPIKPTMSAVFTFLFLHLLAISFCNGNINQQGCIKSEREALLRFKQDLIDPSNRLASWSTGDADFCTWSGVVCDNLTGHVLELNLRNDIWHLNDLSDILFAEPAALTKTMLRGEINPSLLNLTQLISLDFSCYDFKGVQIPKFLGYMRNLRYLNLSISGFQGGIPHQLGNLSNLKYLDIGWGNSLITDDHYEDLQVENLRWLSGLSLLKYLDLTSVDLSKASDWLQVINTFPSLKVLNLISCQLHRFPPQPITNLSSLAILHLSDNQFEGPIPDGLQNLTSLRHLYLPDNNLNSSLPDWWYKLSCLEILYLRANRLQGRLDALGNLTSIKELFLSSNRFEGGIPVSFRSLCNLRSLFISEVQLNQEISAVLDIFSRCVVDVLEHLQMRGCGLFGHLTSQIGQFKNLNTHLLDYNSISGPVLSTLGRLMFLDLSSNNLSGPLPLIPFSLYILDLSNNSFSGSLFHFLCHEISTSKSLMQILMLEKNLLHGNLPDCWMNFPYLKGLDLNENKFSGNIPISFGSLSSLQYLHLRKNHLFGTIPVLLRNCAAIVTLDLGENAFVGNVPTWLGVSFPQMVILILRSNKFQGLLPRELCHLAMLQVLDVADNNFRGTVPPCISNFNLITNCSRESSHLQYVERDEFSITYVDGVLLVNKGQMVAYNTILKWVRIIDLSKNNFSGEIPVEVTKLVALQALNLSHNHFTGRIPENIGAMKSLKSIDLSDNQFFGEIPQSISNLTFLSDLNFSSNKLIGEIPLSTQIQGFDASCFTGNDLCGPPLPKNCGAIVTTSNYKEEKDDSEYEVDWFYVSMSLGFMVGFWAVISPLLVSRRWRFMYYNFLDSVWMKFGSVVRKCCGLFSI